MHIVLHEPEIPGNTGNIGRSCAATNTSLHLIEPLGFEITEKELRRAGLDYWAQLDVHRYRDYEDFMLENFGGSDPQTEVHAEKQAEEKTGCKENSSFLQTGSAAAGSRPPRLWYATTKAKRLYCEADFGPDDYISRYSGRNPGGSRGHLHTDPHGVQYPLPESVQCGCDRLVRGPSADRIFRIGAGGRTPQAALEINNIAISANNLAHSFNLQFQLTIPAYDFVLRFRFAHVAQGIVYI